MDTYTEQELIVLQGIINEYLIRTNSGKGWPLSVVKEWINNYGYHQKIEDILEVPYDQLPLYINDKKPSKVIIAQWRLKIGH